VRSGALSNRRSVGRLAPFAALLLPLGCSSAERVQSDAHWPVEWRGLALYRHEGELAYASSGGAAAQVCALAHEVAGEFRTITGAEPTAWIHVAVDRGDPPIVDDPAARFPGLLRESRALSGEPVRREDFHSTTDAPVAPETLFAMLPLVLRRGTLGPEGSPDVPFRTLLPTSDRLAECIDELFDAALEEEGVGFWERTLLAPVLPFAKRAMRRELEKVARLTLFQAQVAARPDWPADEREAYLTAYREAIGLDAGLGLDELTPGGGEVEGADTPSRR
jgi:hypothetical protein